MIQFDAKNQFMAVVVKYQDKKSLFIKGSPEKILSLTKKEHQPSNFQSICDSYCNKGYRLLAFGSKNIEEYENVEINTLIQNLELAGLIVFENKLKENTVETIKNLKDGEIQVCMITGDHILTAIQIARECGIVDEN